MAIMGYTEIQKENDFENNSKVCWQKLYLSSLVFMIPQRKVENAEGNFIHGK